MMLYTESFAYQTDHFPDAFVRKKVARVFDVAATLCLSKV